MNFINVYAFHCAYIYLSAVKGNIPNAYAITYYTDSSYRYTISNFNEFPVVETNCFRNAT